MLKKCKRSLSAIMDMTKKGKVKTDKDSEVVDSNYNFSEEVMSKDHTDSDAQDIGITIRISSGSDFSADLDDADANNNR